MAHILMPHGTFFARCAEDTTMNCTQSEFTSILIAPPPRNGHPETKLKHDREQYSLAHARACGHSESALAPSAPPWPNQSWSIQLALAHTWSEQKGVSNLRQSQTPITEAYTRETVRPIHRPSRPMFCRNASHMPKGIPDEEEPVRRKDGGPTVGYGAYR
jgi:hypothetical protein